MTDAQIFQFAAKYVALAVFIGIGFAVCLLVVAAGALTPSEDR